MASIDKLAIRGIRAFSPDSEQVIEFSSPLTMIVGENGCGKTTIIECLKYACSGSLPPGSRNGQSFINDPQMSGRPEVKASIKMKFRNRNGHEMVCTRNFSLTQKRNTLQFRALDGAITTRDENGHKVSTSHKCSDLDREIPQHLGVSDAILENVIFCHQEDSNWPLQEGKELKARFDAIFESTRYTKAMDAIKKARKEYNEKVQNMKADLAALDVSLQTAQGLRVELEDLRAKTADNERESSRLDDEIDRLTEKIADIKAQLDLVSGRETEIEQTQWRIQQAEQNIREKESLIDVEFVEDDDELRCKLDSLDAEVEQQEQRMAEQEAERTTLNTRVAELRDRQNKIQQSRGQLMAEQAQLQEMRSTRDKIAKDVVQRYKMPKNVDIPAILERLGEQLQQQEQLLKEVRETNQNELRQVEQRSTEIQRELSRISAERRHLASDIESVNSNRATVQHNMGSRRITAKELEDTKAEFEQAQHMYESLSQGGELQEVREQLRAVETSLLQLQADLENEKAIIGSLKQHKDEIDRAKHEQRQFANQEAELAAQLQTSVGKFVAQFSDDPKPVSDLAHIDECRTVIVDKKHQLEAAKEQKQREVDAAQQQLTTVQTLWNQHKDAAKAEAGRVKQLQAGIPRIQQLLDDFVAKASLQVSLEAFDDAVQAVKSHTEEAKTDLIVLESRPSYNDWLIRRAEKAKRTYDHYICPCCDRPMNNDEYTVFKRNQENFLNEKWRSKVDRKRTELEERSQLLSELEKFLPIWHELQDKRKRSVQLEREGDQLRADKDSAEAELHAAKSAAEELHRKYEQALQLAQQVSVVHEQHMQMLDRRREMTERQKRSEAYSRAPDGRTLDEVELQHAKLLQQREDLQQTKDRLHTKERQLNQDLMQYLSKKEAKQREYEQLSRQYDRQQHFEQQLAEADARIAALKAADETLAKEERPLLKEAKNLEDEKRRVQAQAVKQEEDVSEELNRIGRDVERLRGHHRSIEQLERKGIDERFAELERDYTTIEQRIAQVDQELQALDARRQAFAAAATNSASARRTIQDNLSLRASRAQLVTLRAELQEMQRQVGADIGDIQKLRRECDRSTQEHARRCEDKARLIGAREQLDESVRALELKLGSKEYRDIDGRHRRTLIEFETTKYAVQDLDNYWAALDRALSNYHTLKIREVNKIIKDLWRLTYRGEDIDSIEIRSGEESGSTRAARSYNYRVVMSKNGTELDMRGRCSAGQRVLACLVIRLALAETFCLHCGILALDEPTTNLDENNKEGLAHALALIIAGRARQHNFQLVCITHELDFVTKMRRQLEALSTFTPPQYWWLVRREKPDEDNPDDKYFSKIFRQDWDDL